ncbi:MAG: hypothetical protein EOO77_48005 [Oxalobacteraceae bacterium]|nr:MAG: hypothetical protein EOO77_48005 [Oxalobacteraceae bacterium]
MRSSTLSILRAGLMIASAVLTLVPALRAQEPSASTALAVSGRVRTPDSWTATRLSANFAKEIKNVSYRTKDKKRHKSRCVPLWSVLNRSGFAPADAARKNGFLTLAVTAIGGDGYAAMFS